MIENNKFGYINANGDVLVEPKYQDIYEFKNGIAKVIKNNKFGYINANGDVLIQPEYQDIYEFKDGVAKVIKNNKFGYINSNGKELLPCVYAKIETTSSSKAAYRCYKKIDKNMIAITTYDSNFKNRDNEGVITIKEFESMK